MRTDAERMPTSQLRRRSLFALGGTAVAGAKLLVTGANVRNHSLTGGDIEDGPLSVSSPAVETS